MSAELLIANHLPLACGDLHDARVLGRTESRNAFYHLEQAAEKLILALLTSENKHGNIRHRLAEMIDLIPDENPLKAALRTFEELEAYATSFRYPTSAGRIRPMPSNAQLEKRAAAVADVLERAITHFKVELDKPNAPAGTSAPVR